MKNIEKYLKISAKAIDRALGAFLPSEKQMPRTLHRAMRYSVFSGGKRIRPIIVMASAEACGSRSPKNVMAAACAVELVHSYSLIHDDLPAMDNDDYRRGKPSCHRAFGEANAILAGDALLTLAFNILASNLDAASAATAVRELSEAIGTRGMVGGQAIDISFKGKRPGIRDLNSINTLKTARLFEVSAKLGAIAARATPAARRALASYGASAGLAFQIADDIADGEGYARLTGMEKARLDCEALVLEAKAALKIFGKRTEKLKALAEFILRRGV